MTHTSYHTLSLSGEWSFRLDRSEPDDPRSIQAPVERPIVSLPGTLVLQGVGDSVAPGTPWLGQIIDRRFFDSPEFEPYRQPGRVKVPFWLQPERHYVGGAWFEREFEIPENWSGLDVELFLERAHWKTELWLDGEYLGSRDSLSVPHVYPFVAGMRPGRHHLRLRVDNSLIHDIGVNSHSISDHTQGNWNGVIGTIELRAKQRLRVEDLQVFPAADGASLRVKGVLVNGHGTVFAGKLVFAVNSQRCEQSFSFPSASRETAFDLALVPERPLSKWSEFSPVLHTLAVSLETQDGVLQSSEDISFGVREISRSGRQLLLNGRPLFLRGALECGAFPLEGHPPMDLESWKKEFRTVQAHGLNHLRFHSWCPPEAAFEAADALGLYLQIEAAAWPNDPFVESGPVEAFLGEGHAVDGFLESETVRILKTYGNHPSFILFCACNEPGGKESIAWLAAWVARHRAGDTRRLYTAGAGWPATSENDYDIPSEPRIQHWTEGLGSRINALPPETASDYKAFIQARTVPVVSHEIGQWCAYPNFDEIRKYTGLLKPRNFEIFRESLARHNGLGQAGDFLKASGKLQVLCYKEDIESALRTPQMGGFQLLGLNDFPGQGTALVGVLDVFWADKGYVRPEEFRRFCDRIVPLARLEKRVFTTEETLVAGLELANFGEGPLEAVSVEWKLVGADGHVHLSETLPPQTLAVGAGQTLGSLAVSLACLPAPAKYKLVLGLRGTAIENDWDLWVYPERRTLSLQTPAAVLETSVFDETCLSRLAEGGTVWLTIPHGRVRPDPKTGPVALGFSSIFWNTSWTSGQAPHTLGVLCDPAHPLYTSFPTEAYSNWQWWYPLSRAGAMILDALPAELRPVLQVVDDWSTNRKLGLIVEGRLGSGRLLVTSIDLAESAFDPVCRQLRHSILSYLQSPAFSPQIQLSREQVQSLLLAP